jgi:hypothetical protein
VRLGQTLSPNLPPSHCSQQRPIQRPADVGFAAIIAGLTGTAHGCSGIEVYPVTYRYVVRVTHRLCIFVRKAETKSISSIGTEGSAERLEALIAARARVLCRGTARKASAPR